jgi:uncharacterized protein (DUF58 family)
MKHLKRSPLFHWEFGRSSHFTPMGPILSLYFSQRRALNTFMVFAILVGFCLISSLFSRLGFVFGLSLISYLALQYFRVKRVAEGLDVLREAPSRAVENDEIEVTLKIKNLSPFPIEQILVRDRFEGSTQPDYECFIEKLEAGRSLKIKYKKKCDAGMGQYNFKDLSLQVSDGLGIFEFVTQEDSIRKIDIYPKIQEVSEIEVRGSPYSILYGIYDEPSVGSSVNFIGIREFTHGDSLKHVAWKLSAKREKLLVKEFEKLVNTDVSVVMNMDGKRHVGVSNQSTWEFSKDLVLSLLQQEIRNGNSVQVLSQSYYLPMGRGESQAQIAALSLHPVMPEVYSHSVLDQYEELIDRGTTVFYVTPFWQENMEEDVKSILKLRQDGVRVVCFFLEPRSFAKDKLHGIAKYFLLGLEKTEQEKKIKAVCDRLKKADVDIYWVKRHVKLSHALKKEISA